MDRNGLVAQRMLLYTSPDNATPRPCTVGITAPRDVATASDDTALQDAMAVCEIVFEGLAAPPIPVHGADSLQALAMACDIDPYLRGLERQQGFEFFWDDGSPYFEPSV
jgi:hypothetical protein